MKTTKNMSKEATGHATYGPEDDTFDAWFNDIIIIAYLLLAFLAGCGAGYAYAQRRRPAPVPSQAQLSQAQLLGQNYDHGIYADELVDWHDTTITTIKEKK